MKTFNKIMKSVVIAVIAMVSVSANAQKLTKADSLAQEAHIQSQLEATAYVASAMKGTANDVEFQPKVENSLVTEVTAVRHSSLYVSGGIGGTTLFNSADDEYGNSTVTSLTASVSLEYIFKHKVDAKMAWALQATGLFNSKTRVENLTTNAWAIILGAGAAICPCDRLQITPMFNLGYINRTSQKHVTNNVFDSNVDFNSNPMTYGGSCRISYTVGYTKKVKNYNVKGQDIKGVAKTPVDLFAQAGILFNKIDKPVVNGESSTLNQGALTFLIGVRLGL